MHVFVKLVQYLVFIAIIWEVESQVVEFEIIIEQIIIEFTEILEFCREINLFKSIKPQNVFISTAGTASL